MTVDLGFTLFLDVFLGVLAAMLARDSLRWLGRELTRPKG
jgi:hypothetical protein